MVLTCPPALLAAGGNSRYCRSHWHTVEDRLSAFSLRWLPKWGRPELPPDAVTFATQLLRDRAYLAKRSPSLELLSKLRRVQFQPQQRVVAEPAPLYLQKPIPRPLGLTGLLLGRRTVDEWQLAAYWGGALHRLAYTVCSAGVTQNNRATFLPSGDAVMAALWKDMRSAKHRIWLESYILDDSPLARRTLDELIAARKRGVKEVTLLVDWIGGGLGLRQQYIAELERNGVAVVIFNQPKSLWDLLLHLRQVTFRDHRKLFVCDNVGYCGSGNICAELGSGAVGGSGRFADCAVRLEGPAVTDLAEVFCNSLRVSGDWRANQILRHRETFPPFPPATPIPREAGGGMLVAVLESDPRRNLRDVQRAYQWLLRCATDRVLTVTSYFAPPRELKAALVNALKRGIDVDIFISGLSDVWGDTAATNYLLGRLIRRFDKRGCISIWRSSGQHLHSKLITVDGLVALIGSFNWDRTSYKRNLEVAVAVLDPRFTHQVDAYNRSLSLCQRDRGIMKKALKSYATLPLPFAASEASAQEQLTGAAQTPECHNVTAEVGSAKTLWLARLGSFAARLMGWVGGQNFDQYPADDAQFTVNTAQAFRAVRRLGFRKD